MLKKLVSSVSAFVLAVSLVPAPAFAAEDAGQAGDAALSGGNADALMAAELEDSLSLQALPVPTQAHYKWYTDNPDATTFTLGTVAASAEFVAFANLVNGTVPTGITGAPSGAVDFAGKTVKFADSVTATVNLGDATDAKWTPIGSAEHPFKGAFDANRATVDYFAVSGTARAAYLGLFGYVGEGGSLNNVKVGSNSKVVVSRAASSRDAIHHVAGVAGYCAGTMSGCVNNASVTVASAVVQTTAVPQPVKAIGGVAGECVFNMDGCTNNGAVSVAETSNPVGSVNNSGLVYFVGGVVGVLGDSTRIGTSEAAVTADAAKHGALSNSANMGKLYVHTPSEAGLDRFGKPAAARSVCVGGVAGYSQGSVTDCVNGRYNAPKASDVGYVRAEHGSSAGGIVGSLRGMIGNDNPTTRTETDDGIGSGDNLVASGCTNYGDVYGLNAVGGIVGHAGTFTTITACRDSDKQAGSATTFIVATRWNKPAPAGIVGSTNGDVSFCVNQATVASGVWVNESARTISNATGYYVSGIAGMVSPFTKLNSVTHTLDRVSPVPEIYSCLSLGKITVQAGYRERGLVGENSGYVHDNVQLKGIVNNDDMVYKGSDASGNDERNWLLDASAASDTGSVINSIHTAVEKLNRICDSLGWQHWWVYSGDRSTDEALKADAALNYGYPVLDGANPTAEASRTDLAAGGWTATAANAAYTGGTGTQAAMPAVTVSDGTTTLVQNADYRVVPDTGNKGSDLGSGYTATVIGIGQYKGQVTNVAYSIEKGKLADCTVTFESDTFDYNEHYPDATNTEKVQVRTAGGALIDPSEYELVSVTSTKGSGAAAVVTSYSDEDGKRPVNRNDYEVTLRVKPSSAHFLTDAGQTLKGTYRILPADLMRVVDWDKVSISFQGKTYPWVSSSEEASLTNPKTTLPYTGSSVKPSVSGVSYNDHALVADFDYKLVYGNPDASTSADDKPLRNPNPGVAYGTSIGIVTVRFMEGGSYSGNFTDYVNMYFKIVDTRTKPVAVAKVAMYRMYNPNSGEHFYTKAAAERDNLVKAGWKYEGLGWNAPATSSSPVYRLYSGTDHHYTMSAAERDSLRRAGWSYEGVGWYSDDAKGVPLYRQFNPNVDPSAPTNNSGSHNYTTSKAENDALVRVGWRAEGVGWYGVK